MSHKKFIQEFQNQLPKFLQEHTSEIYQDVLLKIDEGLKTNGVEFRGYFSIVAKTGKVRNTFKTKLLHPTTFGTLMKSPSLQEEFERTTEGE